MERVLVDIAVVGGGAAGLSLLAHLAGAGWEGSLALIDDGKVPLTEKSWAWWSQDDDLVNKAATSRYPRALVAGHGWARVLDLAPYDYRVITGDALLSAAMGRAAARIEVRHVTGVATHLDPQGTVMVEREDDVGVEVVAEWVFDSVGIGSGRTRETDGGLSRLDFHGVVVTTRHPVFDPQVMTLMDFRTSQADGLSFMYVRPVSACEALVERTTFVLPDGHVDHAPGLHVYIDEVLGIETCDMRLAETGTIELGATRVSSRGPIVATGSAAGAVKASTGFAFGRIQRHSAALAASLVLGGSRASWPTVLEVVRGP